MDNGIWGQTQETAIVDVDAEWEVYLLSVKVHGLVVADVQGTTAVADHVVKHQTGGRVERTSQYS